MGSLTSLSGVNSPTGGTENGLVGTTNRRDSLRSKGRRASSKVSSQPWGADEGSSMKRVSRGKGMSTNDEKGSVVARVPGRVVDSGTP